MHEYSVAYDIFMTAKKAAEDNFATHVKQVNVGVGEMTMINPEQVEFLFGTMCEDDPLFKNCVMKTSTVPVKSVCTCGYEGNERFVCPKCNKLPQIVEGRDVTVTNIEIEVDDDDVSDADNSGQNKE